MCYTQLIMDIQSESTPPKSQQNPIILFVTSILALFFILTSVLLAYQNTQLIQYLAITPSTSPIPVGDTPTPVPTSTPIDSSPQPTAVIKDSEVLQNTDSGIEGLVMSIDGGKGGPRILLGQDSSPSLPKPYEGEVFVSTFPEGKIQTTVKTGVQGEFSVPLVPGDYWLSVSGGQLGGTNEDGTSSDRSGNLIVHIKPHQFLKIHPTATIFRM